MTRIERTSEDFLRGVCRSTTTYTEGWRQVCAELLVLRHTIKDIRETVEGYQRGRFQAEDALSDVEESLKREEEYT